MSDPIVRLAARGDGVGESGRFVPGAVPGDRVGADGGITWGPHHQPPPCRHFPECGGCQLQHVDDAAYRQYLVERIASALGQHRLETDIRAPHLSPPRSRRRAALRALRMGRRVALGFHAARSHRIVDMAECHVLTPQLFAVLEPLRRLLAGLLTERRGAEVRLTLADQGVDLLIEGVAAEGLAAAEALTDFASAQRLARLAIDDGLGAQVRFEPEPATITLSGVAVALPPGAFLQATADGEAALIAGVREALGDWSGGDGAGVADLFAGLGTFALALDNCSFAVEAARDSAAALLAATRRTGRAIAVEQRDLYRRPMTAAELGRFAGAVIDPPRAGAAEQMAEIARSAGSAASKLRRIAYVSCNPATFARDSAILAAGGWKLLWARPVGQFRWSTQVELVAAFER